MKKVMTVFGTRPEAIKMCPVVKALKGCAGFETVVCVSGQHKEMLKQVLDCFAVTPDYDLAVMKPGQDLFDVTRAVMDGTKRVYQMEKPDIVLVHGDTSTAFAAALSAFYLGIPVGHVEAGLRTYNIASPFPEEFNRQAVDSLSTLYFAPTEQAKRTLLQEHKPAADIFVTGNTGVDALASTVRKEYSHPALSWADGSFLVLLTAHRRENLGGALSGIFRGIKRALHDHPRVKIIYPVHYNPAVRRAANEAFGAEDRVKLIEPLDALDFHNFLARCEMILTDSGGIQEEAPSLGKPVLVLRDTTERPEGVAVGTLKLIGTKEEDVYREFSALLDDEKKRRAMARASNPYGDGRASERIAAILQKRLSQ